MSKLIRLIAIACLAFTSSAALANFSIECPALSEIQKIKFDKISSYYSTSHFMATTKSKQLYGTHEYWYVSAFGLNNNAFDVAQSSVRKITKLKSYDTRYIVDEEKTVKSCVYVSDTLQTFTVVASTSKVQ